LCAGKDYPVQASTRDEMLVWVKAIEDAAVSVRTKGWGWWRCGGWRGCVEGECKECGVEGNVCECEM